MYLTIYTFEKNTNNTKQKKKKKKKVKRCSKGKEKNRICVYRYQRDRL